MPISLSDLALPAQQRVSGSSCGCRARAVSRERGARVRPAAHPAACRALRAGRAWGPGGLLQQVSHGGGGPSFWALLRALEATGGLIPPSGLSSLGFRSSHVHRRRKLLFSFFVGSAALALLA